MNFVHECNKNNRHDTMRNRFVWHSKILTNRLLFINLFVDINEEADFQSWKGLVNWPNPALCKELNV